MTSNWNAKQILMLRRNTLTSRKMYGLTNVYYCARQCATTLGVCTTHLTAWQRLWDLPASSYYISDIHLTYSDNGRDKQQFNLCFNMKINVVVVRPELLFKSVPYIVTSFCNFFWSLQGRWPKILHADTLASVWPVLHRSSTPRHRSNPWPSTEEYSLGSGKGRWLEGRCTRRCSRSRRSLGEASWCSHDLGEWKCWI